MRALRTAAAVLACSTAALGALAATGPSSGAEQSVPRSEIAAVRAATARFHDTDAAVAAGYELLDVCFEDEANDAGMGYHYWVGAEDLDGSVDALAPEALVYEPTDQGLKLVGVEYIVPLAASSTAPVVLGQEMHPNASLGIWVLHAWIWQPNPAGMFEDYNPNVALCP